MSLPAFFFDRVTADIRQQMDGVLALTGQLARQRLTPDVQACVAGVEEAAGGIGRVRGGRGVNWAAQDLEARVREVDSRFGLEVAIGVMLARQIVEGLGGALRSEGGAGAAETVVFDLMLPAAEAPAEQPQTAAER